MGERKQPSPDLFIAQKTIAFMFCLYNPSFPASARDPNMENKTNKMPVGSPLTPRTNCAGVRDSVMSGLTPFVQGAHGKPTGREEGQHHRGGYASHPCRWAAGIRTHPMWWWGQFASLSHAGACPKHVEQSKLLPMSPFAQLFWNHARKEPWACSLPDISHKMGGM